MPRTLLLVIALGATLLAPAAVDAQEDPRADRFGDPLPVGVVARLGTLRFHHSSCAAYSPDGKVVATADDDEVNLWEVTTSRKIGRLPLDKQCRAVGLVFSHNGRKLAAVGWGGTAVQLWELGTFKSTTLVQAQGGSGGGDWGSAAAFSSDDKTLTAATHSTLFVWDVATGKKLKEVPWQIKDKEVSARMVAFSDDGRVAATQAREKVHIWDAQTGALLHTVEQLSTGEVMRFSRDGKMLAAPGHGHWMNLFSVETGKKVHSLPVSERVVALAFSTDGKTLAAASNANAYSSSTSGPEVIQIWSLADLDAPPTKFAAPGISSVTLSPDGNTLGWGCYGETLCFMDRATGKDLRPTESHLGAVKALAYLPDGKRIVSASTDGTIRTWDAETGRSMGVLRGHAGAVLGLAVFPNGKLLASCGADGTLRLWDLEHGKNLAVRKDEGNKVLAAAFSPDGKRLASGGYCGILFLRDPADGRILEDFDAESISSLAFSPDGNTLAVLSDHGDHLLLQNLVSKSGKKIPVKGGGSSVAYSPDGRLLAVGCDETLLLLDTATLRVRQELPGHWNRRGCVAFSPDGRYLASVSDGWGRKANRSIRVFEVATGTEIHSFERELPVFAAAFSTDGSRLAVGGADATAVILDLTNVTGKKHSDRLTEAELSARWDKLDATDAAKAYEARADYLHAPKSAVPFLARRLRPDSFPDAKRVEGLIKKLDSVVFAERENASKELKQLGELIREPMRKALAADPSPEKKQRLEELLGSLGRYSPTQLRHLRAIEILESIATPEAFQVIEGLTKGNPDGLVTAQSRASLVRKQKKSAPLPEIPKPQEPPAVEIPPSGPVRPDREGDPMPTGAVARLGSARWRLVDEPRRVITFPNGKHLAVVNSRANVEFLDAQTGRPVERLGTGTLGLWFDLRMAAAGTADAQKVAVVDHDPELGLVLAVFDRSKGTKVKIDYGRKKEAYPLVPEEIESGGSHSSFTIEYLSAVAFSPDGRTLVGSVRFEWGAYSGKAKKAVKESHLVAWDAATGKEVWKSPALADAVHTILFSTDGKTLTVVDESSVRFWDAAKGRELRRWESQEPLFSACYSPDRALLATGSEDRVLVWNAATGKVQARLPVGGEEIKAIAYSADGKILAAGGNKKIRLWNVREGKTEGEWSDFPNPVEAVAFSGDGKTLFSGHREENVLRRWDVRSCKPLGEMNGPVTPVRILSFSRDSRTLLASSTGEEFYLWESSTGKPHTIAKKDDERFTTDWLATSGQAALLRCEDGIGVQFGMLLTGKFGRFDQIPGLLGSSIDGQRVLVRAEEDKLPCLRVLKPGKRKGKDEVVRNFIWKDGAEVSATLSPDGKTVAAAGKDVVCFFDVDTGAVRRYQHTTDVQPERFFQPQSVKFSPDGSRIALVSGRDKVRIVAVQDGNRLAEITVKSRGLGGVSGLTFSPDGQTLLTTSLGGPVAVWEVASGQLVRRLESGSYLLSPDNRLLAGSADTLKVFDLYSGRVVRECKVEGNGFGNFAFSPDSRLLAASCADTTVVVWSSTALGAKPGGALDEKDLVQVLETGTAADAYGAIGRMVADPDKALPFLERRLRAVSLPDPKHVQRLIADLDSEQADRREAALKRLAEFGALVEPALRAALSSDTVPAGAKKRIEQLLQNLDEHMAPVSAEDVLHIRAVQALERMGTKRARQLLATIAGGAELSPRTRAAAEAQARLEAH